MRHDTTVLPAYAMTKARFRVLIVFYLASLVTAGVDAAYFPAQFSEELAAAYATEALPPFTDDPVVFLPLAALFVLAIVVPPVALFFFRAWGRWLGTGVTAVTLLILPFFGPSLASGIEMALTQLSALMWGSILTLAYFSAISGDFQ